MVKNSLKKLKVPKEEVAPTEKSQDQPDVKLSAKKIKKSKLNGIKAEVNDVAVAVEPRENGFESRQQQQRRQHPPGNLKKRLRDENKFITDILEFMVFPKTNDEAPDSDDEGILRTTPCHDPGYLLALDEAAKRLNQCLGKCPYS